MKTCELTVNNFFAILGFEKLMPKVTGPLLSEDARGKLGRDIVFTSWKGQNRVTGLRVKKDFKFWLGRNKYFSQTAGQQGVRGTFKKAIIEYNKI